MKRGTTYGKKILLGMIAVITMTFCGCGARERGEVISLENLKKEIEVQGEDAIAGSDASSVDIEENAPEEMLDEEVVQEEYVPIKVLLDRSDVAQVQIVNGSNGERITLTEGDYFEKILNYYEQLRIATEGERNQIVGYTYSLTFYDSQSHELQTIVPRTGKVVLDGMVYVEDGSDVGSQLEQYITEHYTDIWGSQQICAYPLNVNETENRPVCIEIPYPPENLD